MTLLLSSVLQVFRKHVCECPHAATVSTGMQVRAELGCESSQRDPGNIAASETLVASYVII